jgi:hypothetical protein
MHYWERRRLLEHQERQEVFGPLLDTCLEEWGKSHRLVEYNRMFEKWTLGELDSEKVTRYFQGGLIGEPDSGIKERLQEYINYIAGQKTKSEYSESHNESKQEAETTQEPLPGQEKKDGKCILTAQGAAGALNGFIKQYPAQFKQESGGWVTMNTPQDFCFWLSTLLQRDIPPVKTVANELKNDVNLETWKRYYREAGISKKKLKSG